MFGKTKIKYQPVYYCIGTLRMAFEMKVQRSQLNV
jgi:hypothetical protein